MGAKSVQGVDLTVGKCVSYGSGLGQSGDLARVTAVFDNNEVEISILEGYGVGQTRRVNGNSLITMHDWACAERGGS